MLLLIANFDYAAIEMKDLVTIKIHELRILFTSGCKKLLISAEI